MELFLDRTYFPTGTNGQWTLCDGSHLCWNIELPWENNAHQISCIPEARYGLQHIVSPKHGSCLQVMNVPQRDEIEVHSANWALGQDGHHPQLLGCLAPVTTLDATLPGVGWQSVDACLKLYSVVFPVLVRGEAVFVTIRKKQLA